MDPPLGAWLEATSGPDEDFVDTLWRTVLRRPVEPEVRADALTRLDGGMSRATLLAELAASTEFARVRLLDDGVAWAAAQRRAGERPRDLAAPPGTDERPIEIPWCLSRYAGEPRLLDVGYAFAEPAYLAGLVALGAHELVGVDLVAAEVPGLTSVVADLRELPFEDAAFGAAVAISTLEHVGRDNSQYGLAAEHDDDSLDRALRELRRVLAADGRLLVTVPTGPGELLPEQAAFAPSEWVARFEAAGFLVWEDELYELGADGWQSVTAVSEEARYGARGPGASAVLCAELRPSTLAARMRLGIRDRRYRDDVRRVTG
ncbi:MAG TPA: class I SAM-dependent methyltransferase [Gaiellaceae bacterium]|nr:class I SAM-dependent methyltransferase [Gaiellaceae bacterium]